MATGDVINIVFGKKKASIGVITLDASIKETHKFPSIVTENPVESGAEITDHVQLKPITLTMEGMITDTPLLGQNFGSVKEFKSTAATILGKASRSLDAHQEFQRMRESREPFDVITGLQSYASMVLEDYNVERDKDKSNALYFTATLKQIRIVESQTTSAPPASKEASDRAAKVKDAGQKKSEEVSADDPLNANPNLSSKTSDPSDLFVIFGSS